MGKNFRQSIDSDQAQKRIQNLTREKEKSDNEVEALRAKVEELTNVLSQSENENVSSDIDIKDIELIRNKRKSYQYEDIEILAEDIFLNGQIQALTLTADKYLISGYRRYHAIELLIKNGQYNKHAKVIYLDQTFKEIGLELFDKMQLSENEQRKSLDNFQLSDLFNEYLDKGYSQIQISELFNRSQSTVNKLIKIKNINEKLKTFCEQIQYYGYSFRKFNAYNLKTEKQASKAIGLNVLYKIAMLETEQGQINCFLKSFKSKLTSEELKALGYNYELKEVKQFKSIREKVNVSINSWLKSNPDKKDIADKVKVKISQALKELE